MSEPNLTLNKIGPESDPLLRNLLQCYLHDMAEWFGIDTQPDGLYPYDTAPIWKGNYAVYLAKAGDSIAGFAMIGSASPWLADPGAHDVHEFFVLRRFRRCKLGHRMAVFLWNEYPGGWLVRVLEANAPALRFWRTTISNYAGESCKEDERVINGRSWRFFRFVSKRTG